MITPYKPATSQQPRVFWVTKLQRCSTKQGCPHSPGHNLESYSQPNLGESEDPSVLSVYPGEGMLEMFRNTRPELGPLVCSDSFLWKWSCSVPTDFTEWFSPWLLTSACWKLGSPCHKQYWDPGMINPVPQILPILPSRHVVLIPTGGAFLNHQNWRWWNVPGAPSLRSRAITEDCVNTSAPKSQDSTPLPLDQHPSTESLCVSYIYI